MPNQKARKAARRAGEIPAHTKAEKIPTRPYRTKQEERDHQIRIGEGIRRLLLRDELRMREEQAQRRVEADQL